MSSSWLFSPGCLVHRLLDLRCSLSPSVGRGGSATTAEGDADDSRWTNVTPVTIMRRLRTLLLAAPVTDAQVEN
eukprot:scaffold324_cov394-Prasinococcus_capsulatus_cf.AAC.35